MTEKDVEQALMEFAERLKRFYHSLRSTTSSLQVEYQIDTILKETLEKRGLSYDPKI